MQQNTSASKDAANDDDDSRDKSHDSPPEGWHLLSTGTPTWCPWESIPGGWTDDDAALAVEESGIALYVKHDDSQPDRPELLAHNKVQLKRWNAELKSRAARWRELKADGAISGNKRLAGYTSNTLAGCVEDVVAAPEGDGNNTINLKAFKLGGYVNIGLLSESDVIDGLIDATRTWPNKANERTCLNTIKSGLQAATAKNVTPKIPADIIAQAHNGVDRSAPAGKSATPEFDSTTDDFEAEPPVFAAKLLTRSDLHKLPDPEPLIDNVLDLGTTALLYGKWSTGKTFIALDWALSVATGRTWFDRPTTGRKVLYVVGEGAFGFKGRADAWETGWQTTVTDESLAILPKPVNLMNAADVGNLQALIEWGGYDFVVLDTLARCMVGADENSAKDCGLVVESMTQLLASTPDGRGVVLGVHHSGKDGQTLRGSSVFEGAMDTVYFTSRDDEGGWITLTREKRKDGPEHDHHLLTINPVDDTNSAVLALGQPPPALQREPIPTFSMHDLADIVYEVIGAEPDHRVDSMRKLYAAMRKAKHAFREKAIRDAVDDLVIEGSLREVPQKRGAVGYRINDDESCPCKSGHPDHCRRHSTAAQSDNDE
jgi:hypothetical protein